MTRPPLCLAALLIAAPALAAPDPETRTRKVVIEILGGAKQVPLEGLKLVLAQRPDAQTRLKAAEGVTDRDGVAAFRLAPGTYYIDLASAKELPYLKIPLGYKGHPIHHSHWVKVTDDAAQRFSITLADACKLTLRAVDVDTGKGIAGVTFATENALAEQWAQPIGADNLGAPPRGEQAEGNTPKTGADGRLTHYVGPRPGWTYFVWKKPPGYEAIDGKEVELKTTNGTAAVEHVFKLRKKAKE